MATWGFGSFWFPKFMHDCVSHSVRISKPLMVLTRSQRDTPELPLELGQEPAGSMQVWKEGLRYIWGKSDPYVNRGCTWSPQGRQEGRIRELHRQRTD